MRRFLLVVLGLAICLGGPSPSMAEQQIPRAEEREAVVLLHGLWRTPRSMVYLNHRLTKAGYDVYAIGYPTRQADPDALISHLGEELRALGLDKRARVHFVGHSLGGIMVRGLHAQGHIPNVGRVVMLGPPNQGSEIVDALETNWVFKTYGGPTALTLGTKPTSLPLQYGPAQYELGIIAGRRSMNPLGSYLIPGVDDGSVSLYSTQLDGMTDFRIFQINHSFLILNSEVADQVENFLEYGQFSDAH